MLFSRNCVGCSDCFGCANLRNKQYHIFNEPLSKEEYENEIMKLYPSTIQKIKSADIESLKIWNQYPQKYMHGRQNTHVTGDYIYECKNVRDSFIAAKLQDSRFCMMVTPGENVSSDCWDFTHFGINSELFYETLMAGHSSKVRFGWFVAMGSQEVEYSMSSLGNNNIFGCVGLKNKRYCILNKQYSEKEYETLREKIIRHMDEMPYIDSKGRTYKYGEFFPPEQSPFGYNETASIYFPLSKKEIVDHGYIWRESDERTYSITKKGSDLPDTFEFADSFKEEIVACEHSNKCDHGCSIAFRFIPYELDFYRKYKLPLPRLCPNCRHAGRVAKTNFPRLYRNQCNCEGKKGKEYANLTIHFHGENHCPNEFETSYDPNRPEIVYCEQCYNAEVV